MPQIDDIRKEVNDNLTPKIENLIKDSSIATNTVGNIEIKMENGVVKQFCLEINGKMFCVP